jgi:hypothetical protein
MNDASRILFALGTTTIVTASIYCAIRWLAHGF